MRDVNCTTSDDYVNLITLSRRRPLDQRHVAGRRGEQRIVEIDGHGVDVPPADHMLIVTNDDRPGVIGTVGTLLGNAGVNIADMDVGRAEAGLGGDAHRHDRPRSGHPLLETLRAAPGILSVVVLTG